VCDGEGLAFRLSLPKVLVLMDESTWAVLFVILHLQFKNNVHMERNNNSNNNNNNNNTVLCAFVLLEAV
jgi:hypothetical protein